MKKMLILLFVSLGLFTACGQVQEPFFSEKSEFYQISLDDKKYYFRYPSESTILPNGRDFYLHYGLCTVSFGQSHPDYLELDKSLVLHKKEEGIRRLEAYYQDDKLVVYAGVIPELNYVFLVKSKQQVVKECIDLVDDLTKSFSDELVYVNKDFGFSLKLPADFKVEYLAGGEGVILKKWIEPGSEIKTDSKVKKTVIGGYKVEMAVYGFENLEKVPDLSQYIAQKYHGYNVEYYESNGIKGFFVEEGLDKEAKRHFFSMSKDGKLIYEAYMKVPNIAYEKHRAVFDKLVGSIEIF